MNNTKKPEHIGSSYYAPTIKTILLSSSQSILTGSNEESINSIQEYDLEQGEW